MSNSIPERIYIPTWSDGSIMNGTWETENVYDSIEYILAEAVAKEREELVSLLKEIIEHIDWCDESKLLALDHDPHPPSVLRSIADRATALLLKKHTTEGGAK